MVNIWVISDTHFNHANMLNFTDSQGNKFRGDRFKSTQEMDEKIIQNWNELVKPKDKVYHLGDVYFGGQSIADKILGRLMGQKRLILGNHDKGKDTVLSKYFEKIYMWRLFKEFDMLLTHVPVHEDCFRKVNWNVHGHTHEKGSPKGPYHSVCVELTDYKPVHIEDLQKILKRK